MDHILRRLAAAAGIAPPHLDPAAQQALQRYPFPGNVRELENILERALTLCEGDTVGVDDLRLPAVTSASEPGAALPGQVPLDPYLNDVEKAAILQALEQTRYNKTAAAKLLGISFRVLRYRLQKLGLD